MSKLVEGISPLNHRTYDSVRHQYDPETGEAQLFVERAVSHDEFLQKMRGISAETTAARELQYERVMWHQLNANLVNLSNQREAEREAHKEEIAELNRKVDALTEELRRMKSGTAGAGEPASAESVPADTVEPTSAETAADGTPAEAVDADTVTVVETTPNTATTEVHEPVVTRNETVETVSHRRRGGVILGIAALALAGFIGYEIGHSENDKLQPNTVEEISKSDSDSINARIDALGVKLSDQIKSKGDILGGRIGRLESQESAENSKQANKNSTSTGGFSGAHVDFYDQQNPNSKRLTGVLLSKNLRLTGKAGAEKLVDSNSKVIVSRVMWTKNGVIVPELVKTLRSNGYNVSYGQFITKHRYASVVSSK